MAQLIVRNLDDDVKQRLQQRARRHGRSTEEEVRSILRQRRRLEEAFAAVLADDLAGRVLTFDRAAATAAAVLTARERRAGRALATRDALVAGIVMARKGTLATGEAERFTRLGVKALDPWRA